MARALHFGVLFCVLAFSGHRNAAAVAQEFEGLQECPKGSDQLLSSCFTQVFRDLQPLLAQGIPDLGIVPLEPVLIPEVRVPIVDNRFAQIVIVMRDVRVSGITGASKSDFTVRTGRQEIDFNFLYPQLVTKAAARVDGHLFGAIPLPALTRAGSLDSSLENLAVAGTFYLSQGASVNASTGRRALRIADVKVTDRQIGRYRAESKNLLRPRWFEQAVNYVQSTFGTQLFNAFVKDPLLEQVGKIVPGFMDPLLTNALVAEYFGHPEDEENS